MEFEDFLKEWHNAAPFIEARTSGSTGVPKVIMLDKGFVRESAMRTNRFFNIGEGSRLHSCVAADFIGGKMMAVRADAAGCRLTWEKPSNRPSAGIGKDEEIDLLAVVPSQMVHILDNLPDMPVLHAVIIGGSPINPVLYDRICRSGLNAFETYGMTETSSHIALRKIGGDSRWFEVLEGIRVETDSRGCLVINFHTGERFVTNDMAETCGDTRFVVTGRYDDVIITGGKKVNPHEVERKLMPYISAPFMVGSEPDFKWGNAVVVRIEDGGEGVAGDPELRDLMRRILESHEVPKKIEHVAALPRTPNGKIKRH